MLKTLQPNKKSSQRGPNKKFKQKRSQLKSSKSQSCASGEKKTLLPRSAQVRLVKFLSIKTFKSQDCFARTLSQGFPVLMRYGMLPRVLINIILLWDCWAWFIEEFLMFCSTPMVVGDLLGTGCYLNLFSHLQNCWQLPWSRSLDRSAVAWPRPVWPRWC